VRERTYTARDGERRLVLKAINPDYSFAAHIGRQPFKRTEDVERIADGLRKAGVLSYQHDAGLAKTQFVDGVIGV